MDHQIYEQWALMPESCGPQDKQVLKQHLQTCSSCRQLAERWETVNAILQNERKLATPAAGFCNRFQNNLETRKAAKHQKQVKKFLLLLIGLLLLLLIASSLFIYTSMPPNSILKWYFTSGANIFAALQKFELVGEFFFRQIPIPFFVLSLSVTATLLGTMTIFWLTTLWKLSIEGATIS